MDQIRVSFSFQEKKLRKWFERAQTLSSWNAKSPYLLYLQKLRTMSQTGIDIHAWVFYTQDDQYCQILPKFSYLVFQSVVMTNLELAE